MTKLQRPWFLSPPQKRWEFLRKAVRKLLVYDVPAGSEVGVIVFDQTAYEKLPLTPTPSTLDERQRLATASMPRTPSRIPQSQKCIICGLEDAVRVSTNLYYQF